MGGRIIRFEPQGPTAQGLAVWPEISASELTDGRPVQRGHMYFEDTAIGLSAGVWDCTAMTTKLAPYSVNEFMILLEGAVTIIDARDRAVTVKAGECFVIPKGMPCVWRQERYVRKYFVIFDDPSGLAPPDPAVLEVLRPDPQAALAPSPGPAPEILLSPPPEQRDKGFFTDLTGQWTVGVWDSTAYRRKATAFPRHELMHILEGAVSLTEEGGPTHSFQAGATFFVPMGTRCDWRSEGYVRKTYCMMQPA
jgi:uncharacterized cupin superfamily protein